MTKVYTTQIRLPSELAEYIQKEAGRMGIAQNALMIMLMEMGKKMWGAKITLDLPQEE